MISFIKNLVRFKPIETPPELKDGEVYYDRNENKFKAKENGVVKDVIGGSGGGGGPSGANTTLSNLTNPTSINADLTPNDNLGNFNLGSFGSPWVKVFSKSALIKPENIPGSLETLAIPSGSGVDPINTDHFLIVPASSDLAISTTNNSANKIYLATGNQTGSGDSKDITLLTGTVTSGIRGKVKVDSSELDVSNSKITNVLNPTNPQDVATKAYVDLNDNTLDQRSVNSTETITLANTDQFIYLDDQSTLVIPVTSLLKQRVELFLGTFNGTFTIQSLDPSVSILLIADSGGPVQTVFQNLDIQATPVTITTGQGTASIEVTEISTVLDLGTQRTYLFNVKTGGPYITVI